MSDSGEEGLMARESQPMLEQEYKQEFIPLEQIKAHPARKRWSRTCVHALVFLNIAMFLVTVSNVVFRVLQSKTTPTEGYSSKLNPLLKQTSYYCRRKIPSTRDSSDIWQLRFLIVFQCRFRSGASTKPSTTAPNTLNRQATRSMHYGESSHGLA